ncbi:MAG: 30S ribosomal protein S15 [Candidatus Micrarchaeota archaeon]|nr:30S ribosomal protein S15 [Candidatus Micrarchaeota archaeon]MDE1848232.1 30S ribosomal protein S15 [Candidatus Micrarchaeota archaeon]MDE1864881.1 30S ribosomal protein S15 [Candidatus Micrarchaeota archaeon]
MARMHTGGHGKAKSRKPEVEIGTRPQDLELTNGQIEEIIVGYAKQNMHQAQIGQALKDMHGVKYVKQVFGKRLGAILKAKGFATGFPQDFLDLIRKAVTMRSHLAKNHRDTYNNTRLKRVESKIWRLTKYYKSAGRIPQEWKYEPERAALLIKSK